MIEPVGSEPVHVMEEGLRGDDERTAERAIGKWRAQAPSRAGSAPAPPPKRTM